MKCSNCGGEIKNNSKFCEFCGAQISAEMKKEQEYVNKAGCPKCGSSNITFNRETQGEVRGKNRTAVVRSTVGMCMDCGHTWQSNQDNVIDKPRKTWLWVLGWIFIFPVPLTILMLRPTVNLDKKLKYGIIAAAWVVYFIIALLGNLSDTSTSSGTIDPINQSTVIENTVKFTIVPEEKGEYGFENTLNAGTEFEETQIVYHIPAGSYKVTNLGEFQGQISAYSDETHKTAEGWEEPASTGDSTIVKPNETVDFTIADGYYLEVHLNGKLEFVKSE